MPATTPAGGGAHPTPAQDLARTAPCVTGYPRNLGSQGRRVLTSRRSVLRRPPTRGRQPHRSRRRPHVAREVGLGRSPWARPRPRQPDRHHRRAGPPRTRGCAQPARGSRRPDHAQASATSTWPTRPGASTDTGRPSAATPLPHRHAPRVRPDPRPRASRAAGTAVRSRARDSACVGAMRPRRRRAPATTRVTVQREQDRYGELRPGHARTQRRKSVPRSDSAIASRTNYFTERPGEHKPWRRERPVPSGTGLSSRPGEPPDRLSSRA
jgi:hypothetical protein